jgi:hypothetical protein
MIKQLVFIAFLLTAVTGCKKDKADPLAKLEEIAGRWKVTETEDLQNGKKVWQKTNNTWFINFREDGIVVDNNGNLVCCPPNQLTINGVTIQLPPATDLTSPSCSSVRCSGCMNWEIEQRGNEIIVSVCNSSRVKYVRD